MLFRANEITHKSCDTMAGKLNCSAEVSFQLDFAPSRSGQSEARTNMTDCSAANLNKYLNLHAWIWKSREK